jgi:hypothetical protein
MSTLTLTDDQQNAYDSFVQFITHPTETVWVLEGYAGTGKSTLVNKLLEDLPATLQTVKLLTQQSEDWTVQLTATTNKACEALAKITKQEVKTIQSFMEMKVIKDYKNNTTKLVPRGSSRPDIENFILFIDEGSFLTNDLLKLLLEEARNCKIVIIGDPAQLVPPKTSHAPVFNMGFTTARLEEVVRSGDVITALATGFRNTVNGAPWPQIIPDGKHIIHLPRSEFETEILNEFSKPNAVHDQTKTLAYTNKTVIQYNQGIRTAIQGVPELEVGDYAICNSYIANRSCTIKTDQTVLVTAIHPAKEYGVDGWQVTLDYSNTAFLPASLEDKKQRLKNAHKDGDFNIVQHIETHWIDLRAAFACTINKSQGSTYKRVFIDLDDVRSCRSPNTLARLMYVATSRASHQIVLTGDLVASNAVAA